MDTPVTTQQPLLLGQLFTNAWTLFTKHWQSITVLTLVISVPLNLISALFSSRAVEATEVMDANFFSGTFSVGLGVTVALLSLAGILIPLGIVAILRADAEGKQLDFQAALRQAVSRWGTGLVTSIIMGILLILLAILLVIPAIIFGVFWAFALYLVMDRNLVGMAALKESKRIVSGYWWKVFGNILAFGIVSAIVGAVVSIPFRALPNGVVEMTITATISSLASSFALVAGYLLYKNLQSLKGAAAAQPKS
jgi:hypothetical protein